MTINTPTQDVSNETIPSEAPRFQLSLDWWAVITALVLVVLVFLGVFTSIPW